MGLFLGVAQGSDEPLRFIHLTYTPEGPVKHKARDRHLQHNVWIQPAVCRHTQQHSHRVTANTRFFQRFMHSRKLGSASCSFCLLKAGIQPQCQQ